VEVDVRTVVIVVALVVVALVATIVIGRVSRRVERHMEAGQAHLSTKRAKTITGVLRVTAVITVWIVIGLTALAEAGVAIGPLLAAAGVGGIVLGLGAQSLVRDLIAGLFILAERQYDVGDVIELRGPSSILLTGEVEGIALRTTTLRALDATRHVIPNGQIYASSNMTRDRSRYLLDLPIPYETAPEDAARLVERTGERMLGDARWREHMLTPVKVLGVDAFADSAVMLRVYLETTPGHQWEVGREFRRRVLADFGAEGIEIPFPQRSVTIREEPATG